MGKGRARHLGGDPTPAHAHARFAELGLAPRPEGKKPFRLKASKKEFGRSRDAFDTDYHPLVLVITWCTFIS
jgi:hypothetical protein